jgi:beta-glucosidase/6-phospho-beta-glucosidase/beta-galactosidase
VNTISLYPMFSRKKLVSSTRGVRIRMPYASAQIVEDLARLYYERYRCPLMITETATAGSVAKRQRWLDDSVAVVRDLRAQGVPLVGYTWWPLFSLVAWAYRQSHNPVSQYLLNMGLWDLDPQTLDRKRTPLVDSYRALATGGDKEMMLRG